MELMNKELQVGDKVLVKSWNLKGVITDASDGLYTVRLEEEASLKFIKGSCVTFYLLPTKVITVKGPEWAFEKI